MTFVRRSFLTFGLWLAANVAASRAEITWASDNLRLPATSGTPVTATFQFENSGRTIVRLLSVTPSCDCLTVHVNRWSVAPGERGIIRVEAAPALGEGTFEWHLRVVSDDSPTPKLLRFTFEAPIPLRIEPARLLWSRNEPLVAKVVTIRFDSERAKIERLINPEETLETSLEIVSGGVTQLRVRPVDRRSAQTSLRLETLVNGQPRTYVITAMVN